jgi:hypothetical protein
LGAKRASIAGALPLRGTERCLPAADEVGEFTPSPRSLGQRLDRFAALAMTDMGSARSAGAAFTPPFSAAAG